MAPFRSPILRTYGNPEVNDEVPTLSHPHVMFYAPGVTDADIGGGEPGGMYPHVIMPGPHGVIILALGEAEKRAKNEEHAEMLQRLCEIKDEWCLPEEQGQD